MKATCSRVRSPSAIAVATFSEMPGATAAVRPKSVSAPPTHTPVSPMQRRFEIEHELDIKIFSSHLGRQSQILRISRIFVSRSNIRIAVGMICAAAVVFLVLADADAAPQKYKYKQNYGPPPPENYKSKPRQK